MRILWDIIVMIIIKHPPNPFTRFIIITKFSNAREQEFPEPKSEKQMVYISQQWY